MTDENLDQKLSIIARSFRSESVLGEDGNVVVHEWVTWVTKGGGMQGNAPANTDKVARIRKHYPDIWEAIKPAYEAWKSGTEEVVEGTPLEALSFLSSEQAQGLRLIGLRTAEDLAAVNDATIGRMPMGGYKMRDNARAFLASRDSNGAMEAIAKLQAQIAELTEKKTGKGKAA